MFHAPGPPVAQIRLEKWPDHPTIVDVKSIKQRFKSQGQAQRFVSTHGAIYNAFNLQRHLVSRNTMRQFRASAMEEWNAASAVGA